MLANGIAEVIPGYGTVYVFWRMAKGHAADISA